MTWTVIYHKAFDDELSGFESGLQDELLSHVGMLEHSGPELGRPLADTLKGSRHPNMKELRFNWEKEVWRIAFAFDPKRRAILLTAGDKCGADQKRFYKKLIAKADDRFDQHLKAVRPDLRKK